MKQRDYVVLIRTGFATSSRGERIGYCIAQSVSHAGLPELKTLGIVRASVSFCVIFRQQSDQIVEAFAHAVIDPGGTMLTFFALQEIANSILGMGAPIECAQGKKLRWYVHKTAAEKESTNIFDMSKSSSSSSSSADGTDSDRVKTGILARIATSPSANSSRPRVCSAPCATRYEPLLKLLSFCVTDVDS